MPQNNALCLTLTVQRFELCFQKSFSYWLWKRQCNHESFDLLLNRCDGIRTSVGPPGLSVHKLCNHVVALSARPIQHTYTLLLWKWQESHGSVGGQQGGQVLKDKSYMPTYCCLKYYTTFLIVTTPKHTMTHQQEFTACTTVPGQASCWCWINALQLPGNIEIH